MQQPKSTETAKLDIEMQSPVRSESGPLSVGPDKPESTQTESLKTETWVEPKKSKKSEPVETKKKEGDTPKKRKENKLLSGLLQLMQFAGVGLLIAGAILGGLPFLIAGAVSLGLGLLHSLLPGTQSKPGHSGDKKAAPEVAKSEIELQEIQRPTPQPAATPTRAASSPQFGSQQTPTFAPVPMPAGRAPQPRLMFTPAMMPDSPVASPLIVLQQQRFVEPASPEEAAAKKAKVKEPGWDVVEALTDEEKSEVNQQPWMKSKQEIPVKSSGVKGGLADDLADLARIAGSMFSR